MLIDVPEVVSKARVPWYADFIGRRVDKDAYERIHGVNGFYRETPEYEERGIYFNCRVKLDEEGYIEDIPTYKEKLSENQGPGRPSPGRVLKPNKEDLADCKAFVEKLVVPLDAPNARKRLLAAADVLPDGWTIESALAGHKSLCDAVKKRDDEAIVRLAPFAKVVGDSDNGIECHPLILAAQQRDHETISALLKAGAYPFETYFVTGRGSVSAYDVAHENKDLPALLLLFPYATKEESQKFEPWDGLELTYALARLIFKASSYVRLPWTAALYYQFKKHSPRLFDKLLNNGVVDLELSFYIEVDDLPSFKIRTEQEATCGGLAYATITEELWTKDDKWFDFAADKYSYQLARFLCDLRDAGEYETCLKISKRVKGKISDEIFYGTFEDFPKPGTDKRKARELMEFLYNKHEQHAAAYWSDAFVKNFFAVASKSAANRALKKTPRMLSSERNNPTRAAIEAASMCSSIAFLRKDDVYVSAIDALLSEYVKRYTEYIAVTREDVFRWLENDLESTLEDTARDLQDTEDLSKSEIAELKKTRARTEEVLEYVKGIK